MLQRSRRLSASGMWTVVSGGRTGTAASKKQTPFSVWYELPATVLNLGARYASKKQTPFSVWYARVRALRVRPLPGFKEADAFQRLVCAATISAPTPKSSLQRSRRLSASGMICAGPNFRDASALQRSRRLSASGIACSNEITGSFRRFRKVFSRIRGAFFALGFQNRKPRPRNSEFMRTRRA